MYANSDQLVKDSLSSYFFLSELRLGFGKLLPHAGPAMFLSLYKKFHFQGKYMNKKN